MTKITDLTALTTPEDFDLFYVVDVSDTTESAAGTSKKITRDNILNSPILIQLETSDNIKFLNSSKGVALGNENYVDGAGIRFPATQSPSSDFNTLDDYEEGNWTPSIVGTSTAGTATYSTRSGTYIKIGRLVHITCYIIWSSGTGTGNLRITGLPFSSSAIYTSFAVGWFIDIGTGANRIGTVYNDLNNNRIDLYSQLVGGGAGAAVAYDAAGNTMFSGCYITVD